MYSGTTLHNKSGNLIGAHQKFDRVARKLVGTIRPGASFPETKLILHFEGNNGPDGIKRKSPGVDEPRHFWDPTDEDDTALLEIIMNHKARLTEALQAGEMEKAAFEAAWMAHAIVDGLTPAHHYPYEAKLTALHGGNRKVHDSVRAKVVIKGDTKRQTLQRNWQMWGAKGLLMSHAFFEFGVSSTVRPLRLTKSSPTNNDIKHIKNIGFERYLHDQAMEIYELNMYERFLRRGWTTKLTKEVRSQLAPRIVRCIVVAWVLAIDDTAD